MPRAYSGDLRRRVVAAAVEGGQSRDAVARRFAVGRSTVYRWVETAQKEGRLAAKPMRGGPEPTIRGEAEATLRRLVGAENHRTLAEHRDRLAAEAGVRVHPWTLGRTLKRLGLTRKKLERQSWLAQELLELAEKGLGITAELRAQHAGMAVALEAGAHLTPAQPIGAGQIAGIVATKPGGEGGDDPHRAAQHGGRRVALAASRSPLVTTIRPEQLLEIVVGARQIRHGIAMEQAGAVAAGHLAEMVDRLAEETGFGAVASHGGEQAIEAAPYRFGRLAGGVAQDPGRLVNPGVRTADRWPQALRVLEPTSEQLAQPPQRTGQPPLTAARSRLATTAASRSLSCRPEAANGGRPSSVIALRTAAQ
jgi:transposase